MPRRFGVGGLLLVLIAAAGLSACKTSGSASSGRNAPPYTRTADNYRNFHGADELSRYLRHDSEAGPLISAHRGGPMPGFPENCIETFDRTLRLAPALLEVDVRMSADSVLLLMHDEELGRTSNGKGRIDEQTFSELRSALLRDPSGIITPFRIPSLSEALAWSQARAVLALDVKPGANPDRVVDEVRRQRAEGRVVIIADNVPDLMDFVRRAPDLNYSVTAESMADFEAILDSGVDPSRVTLWIAVGELRPELVEAAHKHGIRVTMGTYGEIDERARQAGTAVYEHLLQSGVDVIATDRVADAAKAVARVSAFVEP